MRAGAEALQCLRLRPRRREASLRAAVGRWGRRSLATGIVVAAERGLPARTDIRSGCVCVGVASLLERRPYSPR